MLSSKNYFFHIHVFISSPLLVNFFSVIPPLFNKLSFSFTSFIVIFCQSFYSLGFPVSIWMGVILLSDWLYHSIFFSNSLPRVVPLGGSGLYECTDLAMLRKHNFQHPSSSSILLFSFLFYNVPWALGGMI